MATSPLPPTPEVDPEAWEVPATAAYVQRQAYKAVALQVPDELLPWAPRLIQLLREALAASSAPPQLFLLADSTYNPHSVDEVAAAHVEAQCVVHYGRASMTPLSRTHARFVFPRQPLDCRAAAAALAEWWRAERGGRCDSATAERAVVFVDQVHMHLMEELHEAFEDAVALTCPKGGDISGTPSAALEWAAIPSRELYPANRASSALAERGAADDAEPGSSGAPFADSSVASPAPSSHVAGYTWPSKALSSPSPSAAVWVGSSDAPSFQELSLSLSTTSWSLLDPSSAPAAVLPQTRAARATLGRRYALVQRARAARIVGLLVGTLGASGYGSALRRLRALVAASGRKSYTVLVGKPSPAKLANFPEIEVWIHVADAQGAVLDCRDFLAPILVPCEALAAFAARHEDWDPAAYELGLDCLLGEESAWSRVLRRARRLAERGDEDGEDEDDEGGLVEGGEDAATLLSLQTREALQLQPLPAGVSGALVQPASAAEFLVRRREYKGLEAPVVGAAPAPIQDALQGRPGRAAGYMGEGHQ